MSTLNDPEDPADPAGRQSAETPETPETHEPPEAPKQPETRETPEAPETAEAAGATPDQSASTSLYVRRGRTPTLGFWVALAIAVPALVALISSPFFEFPDLGAVVNFVLLVAVMVGLPLAALAALIDAIRHRSPRSRRR